MQHFISAFDLNATGFPNLSPPNAKRPRSASRRTSMGGRCAAPLLAFTLFVSSSQVWSQESPAPLSNWSDADKESFLIRAEVMKMKKVHTGVTGTKRATFSDRSYTHDASIQSVDVSKSSYATARGMEVNFRDSYKYNIAAYRLDRLLNLHMIPVSVERTGQGQGLVVRLLQWGADSPLPFLHGKRTHRRRKSGEILGSDSRSFDRRESSQQHDSCGAPQSGCSQAAALLSGSQHRPLTRLQPHQLVLNKR